MNMRCVLCVEKDTDSTKYILFRDMLFRLALDGRFLLYLDTINLVTSIFMYHNAQTALLRDKADRNSCVKMFAHPKL